MIWNYKYIIAKNMAKVLDRFGEDVQQLVRNEKEIQELLSKRQGMASKGEPTGVVSLK